jgi:PRTRC genetic system ThiF family protein
MKRKLQHLELSSKSISYHYIDNYLLNAVDPITINLIGCGGTGSNLLTKLAILNHALVNIGHRGLRVIAWDKDVVTASNRCRQLFFENDIGKLKSEILINRINLAFGTDWRSCAHNFNKTVHKSYSANIFITCTDTISSRLDILHFLTKKRFTYEHANNKPIYWLDIGNSLNKGQVILSTVKKIIQPNKKDKSTLRNVFDFFPELLSGIEDNNTPSCSIAQALENQDLFINSFMADYAAQLLWTMFRFGRIKYQGIYINLETLNTNPIPV